MICRKNFTCLCLQNALQLYRVRVLQAMEIFMQHLVYNEYGFVFEVTLFNAVMQGEGIEQSVISALNAINDKLSQFDVVVMIRGGGGTSDLSGFDSLVLAENIANFPIPVITGIGHDRDESVLDFDFF